MKFLRPGDMTLFICFVRFLPLPLLFGISVHTDQGRGTECFCGTVAHSEPWNNSLIEKAAAVAAAAALPALFQQVERFWVTAEEMSHYIPPSCHLMALINYPVYSVTELEARGAIPWSSEGRKGGFLPGHASPHAGRLPSSSLSHFMSTQLSQSLIQTLRRVVSVPLKCSLLAECGATCGSHPPCYQVRKGWTRGKVNCDLSCQAAGQTGAA